MNTRLSNALTATVVASMLITTGLVVRRELFDSASHSRASSREPVYIEDWKVYFKAATNKDSFEAPVEVVEFIDLECPFCAKYRETLDLVLTRYPTQVELSYIHVPLPMHRFAGAAARAAECAGDQGHFVEMIARLFEGQARFGLVAWGEFAQEAGVPDHTRFQSCIESNVPVARIAEGQRLAAELNVEGTPTVVINGWKFSSPPSAERLDRIVRSILAGEVPVSLSD